MLILASQSPRRAQLLEQIGLSFEKIHIDIDETPLPGESPDTYALRLAEQKSLEGWRHSAHIDARSLVLGADTVVVVQGDILGKPVDQQDSRRMLGLLSASEHTVLTAIAVTDGVTLTSKLVTTTVGFCPLSNQQMDWYWHTGEPRDKAGSYAIQGLGGQFITRVDGSYSAVVGLPLFETHQLLLQMGLKNEC
ncbi:MAG: septum formation protein [Paraglaciecola sp.]|jgi:septum formation protein